MERVTVYYPSHARIWRSLHLRQGRRRGRELTGFGTILIEHPIIDARLSDSIDDPIYELYCAWGDPEQ